MIYMFDIIVVGGGPAGMTAALYALRNNKKVLILEKNSFGGQITYSPKVENYPGTKQMSGNEFADRFLEQLLYQGAEIEIETVTGIRDEVSCKYVLTEDGNEYQCKAVIIATGVKHRMLGLENEYDLVGNGISFCAVCDGDFYRDRVVAVAGGGNSALQEAILLSEVCKEVVIIQDLDCFTGEKKSQEVLFSRKNVRAITGAIIEKLLIKDGELSGVSLRKQADGKLTELSCDGLFIAIGLIPENEAFADIVRLNKYGYIDAGEDCLTGREGIYTAGDCRVKTLRQLTTAISDGAVAAVAACKYIDERINR
jgi:thioredoxin reductase (NADPH)